MTAVARDQTFVERGGRYDGAAITFHWLTLLLLIGLVASVWLLAAADDGDQATILLAVHRSLGVSIWMLTAARLAWRLSFARVPPLPATTPALQRLAARAV
ncbi:MAG: cytochrome b, partial [Caulobacteraceae bacterium]